MRLTAEGISRVFLRNSGSTNVFTAIQKTDFTLAEGKLTEIVGRSGSGKTTFMNMLCGLLQPSEGSVHVGENDLFALTDKARARLRNECFGIIPQGQTGLKSLTVLENVLAPAAMYGGFSGKEQRAHELLESMELDKLSNVYAGELSGGEMRRMAVARALINAPALIMADEPTADLDDETTVLVLKLLRKCAENGASVLMVTHEREALQYADNVYRMEKGVLTPDDGVQGVI